MLVIRGRFPCPCEMLLDHGLRHHSIRFEDADEDTDEDEERMRSHEDEGESWDECVTRPWARPTVYQ